MYVGCLCMTVCVRAYVYAHVHIVYARMHVLVYSKLCTSCIHTPGHYTWLYIRYVKR